MKNINISIEVIDPATALKYLQLSPGNRPLSFRHIKSYVLLMKAGKFFAGNDAIIFDTNGKLRNGHHRLYAIVNAGVSARFIVRRNVPEEELLHIDNGKSRSLTDATVFNEKYGAISTTEASMIRALMTQGWKFSGQDIDMSHDQCAEAIKKFRPQIDFILQDCFDNKTKSRITAAPILAVFVRAAYANWDKQKVKDKIKIAARYLLDPTINNANSNLEYSPLKSLRDFLLQNTGVGRMLRIEIYNKTQNMLDAFLKNQERVKVTAKKDDLFPIEEPMKLSIQLFDPLFLGSLDSVASKLKNGDRVTPKELAKKMFEEGFIYLKGKNDPVKALSAHIAKQIKNGNLKLKSGIFKPEISNETRINNYIFQKANAPYAKNNIEEEQDYINKIRN